MSEMVDDICESNKRVIDEIVVWYIILLISKKEKNYVT